VLHLGRLYPYTHMLDSALDKIFTLMLVINMLSIVVLLDQPETISHWINALA